jgi:type I restriction enzyme R subunit
MTYAQMMDIPFVYSSNGDGFYEHDFLTGQEREIPLHQFPTYDELCARFTTEANDGAGISPAEAAVINQPYYTSTTTYAPRYYQRITINRCVEEIARG